MDEVFPVSKSECTMALSITLLRLASCDMLVGFSVGICSGLIARNKPYTHTKSRFYETYPGFTFSRRAFHMTIRKSRFTLA